MFNLFRKKTAPDFPENTPPPTDITARKYSPSRSAAQDKTEGLIDAALDHYRYSEDEVREIKRRLSALIADGTPLPAILAVLGALRCEPPKTMAPEQTPSSAKQETARQPSGYGKSQYGEIFPYAPFYDHLSWIKDTEQYQKLYASTLGQPLEICCFCGGDPATYPVVTLLNGWKVHERCYGMLVNNIQNTRSPLDAKFLFDASPNVMCSFRLINSWWPELPPDWQVRCADILKRSENKCEDCGRAEEPLKIVHIKPIGAGGNHELHNLIALCPICAEQYAADPTLGGVSADGSRRTYSEQKIAILEDARKNVKDVRFTYRDEKGTVSIRTITPKSWEKRQDVLNIVGFCYLLNENEAFDIRRMSDLFSG